jgi:hypothetical protein
MEKILDAIRPDLIKGSLSKLIMCVEKDGLILEQFTFQICTIANGLESMDSKDIQGHLRAFMLKLSCIDVQLKPNPPGA